MGLKDTYNGIDMWENLKVVSQMTATVGLFKVANLYVLQGANPRDDIYSSETRNNDHIYFKQVIVTTMMDDLQSFISVISTSKKYISKSSNFDNSVK